METYVLLFFLAYILIRVIEFQLLKRWVLPFYDFSLPIFIRRVTPHIYKPLHGKLSRAQKQEIGDKYQFETHLVNKADNNTLYFYKRSLDRNNYSSYGINIVSFGRLKQEHDGTITFYGSLSLSHLVYILIIIAFPFLSPEVELLVVLMLSIVALAAIFFSWWSYSQLADILLPQTKDKHF